MAKQNDFIRAFTTCWKLTCYIMPFFSISSNFVYLLFIEKQQVSMYLSLFTKNLMVGQGKDFVQKGMIK